VRRGTGREIPKHFPFGRPREILRCVAAASERGTGFFVIGGMQKISIHARNEMMDNLCCWAMMLFDILPC